MGNDLDLARRTLGLLEAEKVQCWLFGGWAEELRGLCAARAHKDIDLLYPAESFAVLDRVFAQHHLEEIAGKRFPHKRAFVLDGVMVELFLVQRDDRGLFTQFWGCSRYNWPADVLSSVAGLRVASSAALSDYRTHHRAFLEPDRSLIADRSGLGPEVALTGGRVTADVVRVGETVRRPMGAHSPFVHRLLRHLRAVGFDGAPQLLGTDELGRDVLSFVEGCVPLNLAYFDDEALVAAAQLLRRFHDATAGSTLAASCEVVCHNDPSPCNFVFVDGVPSALIDFDKAAPGDRVRDIAYAGWLWTLASDNGLPVLEQARRLRLMAESYGLSDTLSVFDAVLRRQAENLAETVAHASSPGSPLGEYAREAAAWQREQMSWLRDHAAEFRAALGA